MSSALKSGPLALNCSLEMCNQWRRRCKPLGKEYQRGRESRLSFAVPRTRCTFQESRSSGLERKVGGKFHLKLNIGSRPIANKYHEGKVKRTLKRELKVPEIAEREANGTSVLGEIVASSRAWCFSPCLSAPVHNRGKLQGHGGSPTGVRMCLVELICGLIHDVWLQ